MSKASSFYNFQITNPTLAKEWHPVKNNLLTPKDVTPGSERKVWWLCKHGHEWQALVSNRRRGSSCPYCNCLAIVRPDLLKEWHSEKNITITPFSVVPGSAKKVWWKCKKGHEWKTTVRHRNNGTNCPYCAGKLACDDNCLQTVDPAIAKEWHPTKNKTLTPKNVTSGSDKKVWWFCRHGHEWQSTISNRIHGRGCPYCHSQTSSLELRVYAELKYIFWNVKHRAKVAEYECDIYLPSINFAIEVDGVHWHKSKYSYDKQKNICFEKMGIILLRLREQGLQRISQYDIVFPRRKINISHIKRIMAIILKGSSKVNHGIYKRISRYMKRTSFANEKGYANLMHMLPDPLFGRSLKDTHDNLAKQWHMTKNGSLSPENVSQGSNKKIWWMCKKGHEWQATVYSRGDGKGCPYCSGRRTLIDRCLAKTHPNLVKEWYSAENKALTPFSVSSGSGKKAWWICRKNKNHIWEAAVYSRVNGNGCPFCSRRRKSKLTQIRRLSITRKQS